MSDQHKPVWPEQDRFPYIDTDTPWKGGDNDGAQLPPVVLPPPPPDE